MGWEKRTFKKKQTVWAQTDENGELAIENGRVPIRYKDAEDAKIYHAHASNLDADVPVEKKKKSKKLSKEDIADFDEEIWKTPEGEVVVESTPRVQTSIAAPPLKTAFIYTDGACSKNPGPCGSGLVVVTAETVTDIYQYIGLGTNNIGELYAIKLALDYCPDVTKLRIFSDSSYAIGVLDSGWKAKANKALVETIKTQIDDLDAALEFVKVRGHSGDELNERADQLAVRATEQK